MTLDELNSLGLEAAFIQFEGCCVAKNWVDQMASARPFPTVEAVFQAADKIWQTMSREDILEAFDGHPRIGDVKTLKEKYARTSTSAGHEQSGMNVADDATIERMAQKNNEYFDRFGFIFIVCATGKSAREMLALLEDRIHNEPAEELMIAAGEQAKITRIRLQKLIHGE